MKPVREIVLLVAVVLAIAVVTGCAAPVVDPWREAARKPIDTGSYVWWETVVRKEKP